MGVLSTPREAVNEMTSGKGLSRMIFYSLDVPVAIALRFSVLKFEHRSKKDCLKELNSTRLKMFTV